MNPRKELRPVRIAAAVLAVTMAAALAQSPPQRRPGLWEVSMPGGQKVQVCVPPERARDFVGNAGAQGSCERTVLSSSATELRYRNVCAGPGGGSMTMEGRVYDMTPERMTSDVTMRMGGMEHGTIHTTAHWVGAECKAGQ